MEGCNDNIVGAVLVDLSKAFDCIPHDLLIAKLHAYGFDENTLVLIYYLKRQKQSVRINNTYSSSQTIFYQGYLNVLFLALFYSV